MLTMSKQPPLEANVKHVVEALSVIGKQGFGELLQRSLECRKKERVEQRNGMTMHQALLH
jgi:hypothetical protein